MRTMYAAVCAALLGFVCATTASAVSYKPFDTSPEFLVTPTKPSTNELIIGTDILNGSFNVTDTNGVEIGQRAKVRYDPLGDPLNQTNFDGVDTYLFSPASGNAPEGLAIWNIETSISLSTLTLNDIWLDYEFTDPNGKTFSVDASFFSILGGSEFLLGLDFSQSSQNPGFSQFTSAGINPLAKGVFTSTLSVNFCVTGGGALCQNGSLLATNSVNISQVPLPAPVLMLMASLAGLGVMRARRRQTV